MTVRRYYQLNLVTGDHDNPEYRIGEDLRIAVEAPVDFASGILSATITAVTSLVALTSPSACLPTRPALVP